MWLIKSTINLKRSRRKKKGGNNTRMTNSINSKSRFMKISRRLNSQWELISRTSNFKWTSESIPLSLVKWTSLPSVEELAITLDLSALIIVLRTLTMYPRQGNQTLEWLFKISRISLTNDEKEMSLNIKYWRIYFRLDY